MWLGSGGGGGVNIQLHLPLAMLVDALPYSVPLQQIDLIFTPPLAPPSPVVWTPWISCWDKQSLAPSFHTMAMVPPTVIGWVIDSDTSNNTTFSASTLTSV
jgi:hypothetical protein